MIRSTHLRPLFWVAPLLAGARVLAGEIAAPADAPQAIRPAPGAQLVLAVHASGAQIYVCTLGAADGKPQWTLKAPDAELRDARGTLVGHHSAGPSWRYKDGSEVTGKAAARADSPDSQAIPWLLVSVVAHTGNGLLEKVASIQRLHTHGGQPPAAAGCDAAKHDVEVRSAYSADYYFYAAAPGSPH
jgi:hypothetical protein